KERADASGKLLFAERLDDVVVGAGLEPPDALELVAAGGEHHDGNVRHVPDPLEDVPPVELRHRDVENHEVGPPGVELAQALLAVRSSSDRCPVPLEQDAAEPPNVVVIVDYENPWLAHTLFIPRASAVPSL